jgi:hypothetical protein
MYKDKGDLFSVGVFSEQVSLPARVGRSGR